MIKRLLTSTYCVLNVRPLGIYDKLANLSEQVEKSGLEEVCKEKDEVLAAKEQEIVAKKRALSDTGPQQSATRGGCWW